MNLPSMNSFLSEAENKGFDIFIILKSKEGKELPSLTAGNLTITQARETLDSIACKEAPTITTTSEKLPRMPAPLK